MIAALVLAVILCGAFIFVYCRIYKNTEDSLLSASEERISIISENTDSFLQKAKTFVDASAGSIEFIMQTNGSNDKILDYLLYQTDNELRKTDENFTGLYGLYRGTYLDGNRWDPYADGGEYYPRERPWYLAAKEGGGEVSIASPYLDMDTGNIILSVVKLLSDGDSVIGLDISLASLSDDVREYIAGNDFEYAYIIDSNGTIVASKKQQETGLNFLASDSDTDSLGIAEMFRKALSSDDSFEYTVNGHKHLVISKTIENGWQVILLTNRDKVFAPLRTSALVFALLFVSLIGVLAYFSFSSIRERRIRMSAEEQEQKYVAELQDYADKLASYKKAILSDALIALEVDLSNDELYYGIWKDDNGNEIPLSEILGISTPCSYDEYIELWNKSFVTEDSVVPFSRKTDRDYLLETFLKGSSEITFDYEAKTVSGKKAWLRRSICMIRNQAGNVIAYTSVKDVTELIAADKREESYIRALSTEYDSIAVVGLGRNKEEDTITIHGRIDDNFAAFVRHDYLEESNFSQRLDILSEMVHPADRDAFYRNTRREVILESFAENRNHTVDFRLQGAEGDNYYQGRFIPLRDDNGAIIGMIACLRNIDSEIRTEFGRRRELEEAKVAAEAASTAKTAFLFNMSHDIRTPMNAILGFTRIAQKHLDDSNEVADCLRKIEVSGEQLLDLINDVLEMSRIESGRTNIDYEPVRVTEAFDKINPMFESLALTKSIDYTVSFGEIMNDFVWADSFHTSRIFTNIISNAIKYTPDGGKVAVRLEQISPAENGFAEYRFTVMDTGIGMSEEFLEHMFEEFAREKNTTVSRQTGTGLGLAIVEKLTDALGGKIEVESKLGKGTKFTVVFPLRIETEEEIRKNHAEDGSGAADDTVDYILCGKRALLVEDNALNREIACEILSELGLAVEIAEDGSLAAELYRKYDFGHFDFILMDIQMPVMDGYEATKAIRAIENGMHHVPIIAVSANAFNEDIAKSLASGMDAHIAKPIDPAELTSVLRVYAAG